MCKYTPTGDGFRSIVTIKDKPREIDRCIAPLVQALNDVGLATVASCCGHGRQPGRITLEDGREVFVLPDHESADVVSKMFPPICGVTP